MTTNVSAHEDNNNSSAVILAQTNPPDPEHTPNSKFFHSARWFRREEIMIRVSSCRRLIQYLPYGTGLKLGLGSSGYCDEERRQERERRERWFGGQEGNPSKWSFQFIPTSYLNNKST
eukprot:scaffold2747_cov80-Skeletonema_dohrnii-CCMP3373.AAC.2